MCWYAFLSFFFFGPSEINFQFVVGYNYNGNIQELFSYFLCLWACNSFFWDSEINFQRLWWAVNFREHSGIIGPPPPPLAPLYAVICRRRCSTVPSVENSKNEV